MFAISVRSIRLLHFMLCYGVCRYVVYMYRRSTCTYHLCIARCAIHFCLKLYIHIYTHPILHVACYVLCVYVIMLCLFAHYGFYLVFHIFTLNSFSAYVSIHFAYIYIYLDPRFGQEILPFGVRAPEPSLGHFFRRQADFAQKCCRLMVGRLGVFMTGP